MSEIPSRKEVASKVLRKVVSPRGMTKFLEFKFVSGNEYPYFDFCDSFPRLANLLRRIVVNRVDLEAPIFLAGLRRSGSTLFYRIMNAHSGLHLFNERFPADRLNGRGVASDRNIYSIADPDEFREIALRYLSPVMRSRSLRWGTKLSLELAHPDPGSISELGLKRILAAFPKARLIGLTRDPRDFVLSASQRGGHDTEWWVAEYLAMSALFRTLVDTCPDSFLVVRYEDLVDEPDSTIRKCCEFAGIDFEPAMLDPDQWSIKGPREYTSSQISARHGRWRVAQGTELDVVRFTTKACFPSAAWFGYPEA